MGSTFGEESAILAMIASGEKARKRPDWIDTSQLCFGPKITVRRKDPTEHQSNEHCSKEKIITSLSLLKKTLNYILTAAYRVVWNQVYEEQQRR